MDARGQRTTARRTALVALSWVLMVVGAAALLAAYVQDKASSSAFSMGGTTTVSTYELAVVGLLGAAPGWLLGRALSWWLDPAGRQAPVTQPRCPECGGVVSREGERCTPRC